MSKLFVALALAAATLGAPVLSFAQSSAPLTRAEVRADLVRVEQAGYNPSRGDDVNYPADVQAAEARIAAQNDGQLTDAGCRRCRAAWHFRCGHAASDGDELQLRRPG